MQKLISIVIPVYNEEMNVEHCYSALKAVTAKLEPKYRFEFVFTDNCSTDNTFIMLNALAAKDGRIRVYRFSKNYGYQKSILTGYQKARGDAAIAFDCDLQDPPVLLNDFIKKWEEGYKVVYGVRISRQESKITHGFRKVFYRLINSIGDCHLPEDAGDFRLIDKVILDLLRNVKDQNLYLRGVISEFGFAQAGIPYHRNKRERGVSKFPYKAMFSLAKDGIVNHSRLPLRLATYIGLAIFIFTWLLILLYLILYFTTSDKWPPGFATIVFIALFSLSINSLLLGIVGEYLRLIFVQMKNRPIAIIENEIGTEE